MTRPAADRVAGVVAIVAAALIALEARTFTVRFLTDPIGPKALPLLVAALFATAGVALIARPAPDPPWPSVAVWGRGAVAVVGFLTYASVLPLLGFFLATTLVVAALAVLFRGPPRRAMVAAAAYSAALYVLFAYVLGLSLPIGSLLLKGH